VRAKKFGGIKFDGHAPPTSQRKFPDSPYGPFSWRAKLYQDCYNKGYRSFVAYAQANQYFGDLADITDWLKPDRRDVPDRDKRVLELIPPRPFDPAPRPPPPPFRIDNRREKDKQPYSFTGGLRKVGEWRAR
jgi:hypothetical protein